MKAPLSITACITRVPGDGAAGLAALADALLLLTGDPALDAAFKIANNFNIANAQLQTRRRVLKQTASALREQLVALEQQIDEAA
jgi:hypothetical protein